MTASRWYGTDKLDLAVWHDLQKQDRAIYAGRRGGWGGIFPMVGYVPVFQEFYG